MKDVVQSDPYSHYELGLHRLLNKIDEEHPTYQEALVYQQRLSENIAKSRQYGDNDTRKTERSEIIDRLNELAAHALDISFSGLCSPVTAATGQEATAHLPAQDEANGQPDAHSIAPGTMPIRNPYSSVAGVSTSDLFFDRERDLVSLLCDLFSDSPQCCSIIGQSKIGKTALLQELMRPEAARAWDLSPEKVFFVYLDCRTGLESEEHFYRTLLKRLKSKASPQLGEWPLGSRTNSSSNHHYRETWRSALEELDRQGYNIVALFDEFERAIIRKELIQSDLFVTLLSQVRAVRGFSWVACTPRPLQDIFEDSYRMHGVPVAHQRNLSAFFVDAMSRYLKLFTEKYVLKVVTVPAESEGLTFSEKDIEHIIGWGGRFPFFIQRACAYLFEARVWEEPDYDTVAQRYLEEARQHWERYWRKLDYTEQALLVAIAFDRATSPDERIVRKLKQYSLVYEDQAKLYPFSETFCDWIKEKSESFGEEIWSGLSSDQQKLLMDIALDRVKLTNRFLLTIMKSNGLVYEDEAGQLTLFSDAFRDFVESKAPSTSQLRPALSDEQVETLSNWFEEAVGNYVREERGYTICRTHYRPPYAKGEEEMEVDVYARKETSLLKRVLIGECKLRVINLSKPITLEEVKQLVDQLEIAKRYEQKDAEERGKARAITKGMLFTNAPRANEGATLEAKRSDIQLMHVNLSKDWVEKALRQRPQRLDVREMSLG